MRSTPIILIAAALAIAGCSDEPGDAFRPPPAAWDGEGLSPGDVSAEEVEAGHAMQQLLKAKVRLATDGFDPAIRELMDVACGKGTAALVSIEELFPLDRVADAAGIGCGSVYVLEPKCEYYGAYSSKRSGVSSRCLIDGEWKDQRVESVDHALGRAITDYLHR